MDENNQEIQETEVILTQGAVEQLIENIKNADSALQATVTNNILGSTAQTLTFTPGTDENNQPIEIIDNIHLNGIANYIGNLDYGPVGNTSNGSQYIASIKQINGKIEATTASAETTYNNDNMDSALPTSNSAITAAINTLQISTVTANNGEYIKSIGQSVGKVTATTASFNPYLITEDNLSSTTPTQSFKVNIDGITGTTSVLLKHATTETYGVVKLENSVTATNNAITSGAVYAALDGFSPCITLKNQPVYLTGNTITIDSESNTSIATYLIEGITIIEDSVIMVTPVFNDNPNEKLLYSRVTEAQEANAQYFILNNNNFIEYNITEDTNWQDDNFYIYIKNEGSNYSSWDIWSAYGIICDQDKNNLNQLNFYLNGIIDDNRLADVITKLTPKEIKMDINLVIFNYEPLEQNGNNQQEGEN